MQRIEAAVDSISQRTKYGVEAVLTLRELYDSYRQLSRRDGPFDPTFRPPGAPGVPVSCGREGPAFECYKRAQAALNRAAIRLEKLRIIHARTKDFKDKAIAFGTAASSIHAVQGLAWLKAKKEIETSFKKLEAAYDAKKPELMAALRAALDMISRCEDEHFQNRDWYDRFGFMYYQFMDGRYTRP